VKLIEGQPDFTAFLTRFSGSRK